MLLYIILLSIFGLVFSSDQMDFETKIINLVKQYPTSPEAYDYITQNEQSVFNMIHKDIPIISPYGYLKPDASRFIGKAKLDAAIAQTATQIVKTPTKSLYLKKLPDGYDCKQYCVVSQLIKGMEPEKITFPEMKQLFAVFTAAQYKDVGKENILRTPEGQFYIIDTALNGFSKRTGKELESKIASRLLYNFRSGELSETTRNFLDFKQ